MASRRTAVLMDSTGATIVGGMVYQNSGYSRIPVMPGNVFLAFSVDGKDLNGQIRTAFVPLLHSHGRAV